MIGVTLACAWLGMLAAPGDRLRGYNYIVRLTSEQQPLGRVRVVTPGEPGVEGTLGSAFRKGRLEISVLNFRLR